MSFVYWMSFQKCQTYNNTPRLIIINNTFILFDLIFFQSIRFDFIALLWLIFVLCICVCVVGVCVGVSGSHLPSLIYLLIYTVFVLVLWWPFAFMTTTTSRSPFCSFILFYRLFVLSQLFGECFDKFYYSLFC